MHQYDFESELCWNYDPAKSDNLYFFVICNDQFYWATADGERVTDENIDILEQALKDGGDWGPALFCSRSREMRPQGALYAHIPQELWHWFDATGPERDVEPEKAFGNPFPRGKTIGKDVR
jgi:hypothetical protein